MELIIESPTFYDQVDESIFFNALYTVPGYVAVKGKGINLHIEFNGVLSNESIKHLVVICRRWLIDITPLQPFKNKDNSDLGLWYEAVS